MGNIPSPPVYRIPLIQLAVLLPLSVVAWLFDTAVAYSLLLGGLIHLIPNMVFANRAFSIQGANARQAIVLAMSLGQIWKFGLTVLAFAVVFVFVKPLNIIAIVTAYLIMVLVFTVALVFVLRR